MMVVVLYLQSCGGDCRPVVMSCDGSCVVLTVVQW